MHLFLHSNILAAQLVHFHLIFLNVCVLFHPYTHAFTDIQTVNMYIHMDFYMRLYGTILTLSIPPLGALHIPMCL